MKISRIVGLLCCSGVWSGEAASEDAEKVKHTLDLSSLDKMVTSLRAGDLNIVRPHPTEKTVEQQEHICPGAIPSLVTTLADADLGLKIQGKAAEVLALCTTNNPENREAIGRAFYIDGSIKNTVHSGLVRLIRNGRSVFGEETVSPNSHFESDRAKDALAAVAHAAEAIWILTFNSALNHAGFVEAGAVSALSEVLIDRHCKDRNICSLAAMWSAAALQNLAASYCASETGHCWWDWSQTDDGDVLKIHEQHGKLEVDAQHVRMEIMEYADEAVLHRLVDYACSGPVYLPHHSYDEEDGYNVAWPQFAEISTDVDGDEHVPSIIPWAAVGLLRNLALAGHEARLSILEFELLDECLCEMMRSPDDLESEKADEALFFLDAPECQSPYDDGCTDFPGWKNADSGETCEDYEENRWCVEQGHDVNVDGVPAADACCACGGGRERGDEL